MRESKYIKIIPPVSFLEMILLGKELARLIVTDSGGVQKESHFYQKTVYCFKERD